MTIITIVKGDRRRQCAEADFAYFAARGFEKEGRANSQSEPATGGARSPSAPSEKDRAQPRIEPFVDGHPTADVPSAPVP